MQIIIDIDKEYYKAITEIPNHQCTADMLIIENGIPLPKGHGRLVDADAIPEQIELKGFLSQDNAHLVTIYRVKEALDNAPTIIEADTESEDKE